KACPTPANTTPTCANSMCGATCNTNFADCNKSLGDGCEVDTTTDVNNCGMCGSPCPMLANASSACNNSMCGLGASSANVADCDMMVANGCEINTAIDATNCGKCGMACSFPNAQPQCLNGQCGFTKCNAGFADCNGMMGDGCEAGLQYDPANCGACNNMC